MPFGKDQRPFAEWQSGRILWSCPDRDAWQKIDRSRGPGVLPIGRPYDGTPLSLYWEII